MQAVIAPVGYGPAGVQSLADLLMAWRGNQVTTHLRLLTQKRAKWQRGETRQELGQTVSSFKQTAKAVFVGDEKVLRFLGLRPPRWRSDSRPRNGASEAKSGGEATASRRSEESESLEACLSRWWQMMANTQNLNETQAARLAAAGWDAERLAVAAALVETLALVDSKYKEAIAAHSTQQWTTTRSEHALRQAYKEARQLIRVAIDEAGLENKKQFKALIGL